MIRHPPAYVPPACVTPLFGDVPCANGFSRWIDELANRGITAGCGGGNYCPSTQVSRGQMAVLVKPNGLLGTAYMAAIAPFRHLIVYPRMIREIGRKWRARNDEPTPAHA